MKQSDKEDNFKSKECHKGNKTGDVTGGRGHAPLLEWPGHGHVHCGLGTVGAYDAFRASLF